MEKVSIVEFRRHAEAIIAKVRQGKRLILTYRGQSVMRLEPIIDNKVDAEDPFYSIHTIASTGKAITNEEIDALVYGK